MRYKKCITKWCFRPQWGGHLRCYKHRFIFTETDWAAMMPPKSGEIIKCIDCGQECDKNWRFQTDCPVKGMARGHRMEGDPLTF